MFLAEVLQDALHEYYFSQLNFIDLKTLSTSVMITCFGKLKRLLVCIIRVVLL